MDKKIPDLLRKWIATVDTLPARLIQQLEAERRKAGSRKEKKRGRPAKHPLEELRDAMVDLAVTEQVFKRPPRAASRTIAELSGRGAFKGKSKGALRARHNKQLREMKEQKLEEPIRKAIRDHGKTLYIKRGNLAVRADKVAAASARIKDLEKKVEALSPAEKTQLGRVYWLETPALLNLLETEPPEGWPAILAEFKRRFVPAPVPSKLMDLIFEDWDINCSINGFAISVFPNNPRT